MNKATTRQAVEISARLAELAAEYPSATAVVDATGKTSYAELHTWSDDLANRINQTAGETPRACLIVSDFDRQGIVGLIATLKTAHYAVAIDRQNLPANIAEIAAQLDAGLCVYSGTAEETVRAANLSIPTLPVGALPDTSVPAPPALPDLTRVAILKRSSGSTGNAKTAAYTAESILIDADLGAWVNDIEPGSSYAVVSTFDSAMSAAAILRCLLAGGMLMPVDLRVETPKQAADRLLDAGMTHVHATPTAFRLLAHGIPEGEIFPDLHSAFLSGEKSTPADVRRLAQLSNPDTKLRAAFSSSETQLVAHTTVYPAREPGPEDFAELDVFPGVRIDILNEDGTPKPAGQIGRVRVVSKMVSLGYRGNVDPAVSARFSSNDDGTQSFLTDDMGYLTAEGRLVLTSRAGREVKIRGRRVDLGELEAWLTRQPDIAEAAAVVQPLGHEGAPGIAAFVTADEGFAGSAALRERMQAELIASMRPAVIVERDTLPRTANQKIDRRALENDLSHREAEGGETLAAGGLLGKVAEIWARVLSRPVTSSEADFFMLGGDSITATVAALSLEEEIGRPVDTGFFFRYPLLADQVRALEDMESEATLPDRLLVPLANAPADVVTSGKVRPRVFMIPGAYGLVLPFAPLAEEIAADWDLIGVLHPDLLESAPKYFSVEETAERMRQAIKALKPDGPYLVMGYSFGGAIAHEIAHRLSAAGDPAASVILDTRINRLMNFVGKLNLARRVVREWVQRRRGTFTENSDDFIEFPDLGVPLPGATADDPLPFSYTRAQKILAKYHPPNSAAPTILVKATQLRSRFDEEDFGWSRVAPIEKVVLTPGDHDNLFQKPNLETFAKVVSDSLEGLLTRLK